MALNPADIAVVSRLLEELLALQARDREAWLAALPEEHQRHAATLRDMLARAAELDRETRFATLPKLRGSDADAQEGDRVGSYRLMQEIGRGGMGSVWLAERADGMFEREVALKLPRLSKGPHLAERMARERQIGARLEHVHIARLYDAGVDDTGRPYLVMERVRGAELLPWCASHDKTQNDRLTLFLQACAAVAHAHRHLVVHRDIKPSNLMVDEGGHLKLLDFGIAQLFDADTGAAPTDPGGTQPTHTPGYAAPEQLTKGPVSTLTDVYALGVVLHELLVGARPTLTVSGEVVVSASLAPDLRAVLASAMRTDPGMRCSSVEKLADDLRNVLSHRPVMARPAGWRHRSALFLYRHRRAAAVLSLAVFGAALAGGALWRQHGREQLQMQRAGQARAFLFDFLESAEAKEDRASDAALPMVRAATDRARAAFGAQPVLRGQVLAELGLVQRRLGDNDGAIVALREATTLLESSAEPEDPVLYFGRTQLALALQASADKSHRAEARRLAETSLAACREIGTRCAKARAYAEHVLLAQAFERGDSEAALQHTEQALVETEAGFGATHLEVALILSKRAVLLRNRGAFDAAFADVTRALAIAEKTTPTATDRRELQTTQVLLLGDLGRYEAASRGLQGLLEPLPPGPHRRRLQRLLAQVLLAQGLLDEAERTAAEALGAAQAAGDDWETAFAAQALAGARSALGKHESARSDIESTLQALQRMGLKPEGVEFLRARRNRALLALRAGQDRSASEELQDLVPLHRRTPPAGVLAPVDFAQLLDLQGTLARRRGDMDTATARHSEAAALLETALPSAHPLRLRNAALLELARWLQGGPAAATGQRDAAQRAVAVYLDSLPLASAWRRNAAVTTGDRNAWMQLVL